MYRKNVNVEPGKRKREERGFVFANSICLKWKMMLCSGAKAWEHSTVYNKNNTYLIQCHKTPILPCAERGEHLHSCCQLFLPSYQSEEQFYRGL